MLMYAAPLDDFHNHSMADTAEGGVQDSADHESDAYVEQLCQGEHSVKTKLYSRVQSQCWN